LQNLFQTSNIECFRIEPFNNRKDVILIHIDQQGDVCQDVIRLHKDLEVSVVFSIERDGDNTTVISEIFRRKGDYLSFLSLYVYLWHFFNE